MISFLRLIVCVAGLFTILAGIGVLVTGYVVGTARNRFGSEIEDVPEEITLADLLKRDTDRGNPRVAVRDLAFGSKFLTFSTRADADGEGGDWDYAWMPVWPRGTANVDEQPRVPALIKYNRNADEPVEKFVARQRVEGMVMNRVEKLRPGDIERLKGIHALTDMDRLVLIEADYAPPPKPLLAGLAAGGLTLFGLGVALTYGAGFRSFKWLFQKKQVPGAAKHGTLVAKDDALLLFADTHDDDDEPVERDFLVVTGGRVLSGTIAKPKDIARIDQQLESARKGFNYASLFGKSVDRNIACTEVRKVEQHPGKENDLHVRVHYETEEEADYLRIDESEQKTFFRRALRAIAPEARPFGRRIGMRRLMLVAPILIAVLLVITLMALVLPLAGRPMMVFVGWLLLPLLVLQTLFAISATGVRFLGLPKVHYADIGGKKKKKK